MKRIRGGKGCTAEVWCYDGQDWYGPTNVALQDGDDATGWCEMNYGGEFVNGACSCID